MRPAVCQRESKARTPIITADADAASRYIPAPVVMPAVMAQNRYSRSSGSLTAVRNRTMDSAPTMPSEMTTLELMASVTMQVSTDMPTSVIAKLREKRTPA